MIRLFSLMLFLMGSGSEAIADVQVRVDVSEQSVAVSRGGEVMYRWVASTGSLGYETPLGIFRPVRMHEVWHSRKYDGIPMPNSIFFFRGYAIHGSLDIRNLGRPASRGCVRLHPEDAKVLFDIVREQGMSRTVIIVQE